MSTLDGSPAEHLDPTWHPGMAMDRSTVSTGPGRRSAGSHTQDCPPRVDLAPLPSTYILPTHLQVDELRRLEDKARSCGAPLVEDATQARIFFGKVNTIGRAEFELRCRGIETEVVHSTSLTAPTLSLNTLNDLPERPRKRRRSKARSDIFGASAEVTWIHACSSESEPKAHCHRSTASLPPRGEAQVEEEAISPRFPWSLSETTPENGVWVVKLDWLLQSISKSRLLPVDGLIVYEGQRMAPSPKVIGTEVPSTVRPSRKSSTFKQGQFRDILERAKADAFSSDGRRTSTQLSHFSRPRSGYGTNSWPLRRHSPFVKRPPRLLRQTTSEHEEAESGEPPNLPDWVRDEATFACQRSTPPNPSNETFIQALKTIRHARLLNGDEVGVRAYSTSIAALAAYPHLLRTTQEVLALPGCDAKIASLYQEWKTNDGTIQEVEEAENDETLKVLRLFYQIWGVGAITAREFYDRGWRDLDDVVEYGWDSLNRVQQIGLKFYDELLQKIPRDEVELIAARVTEHAKRVRDDGIECCVVGGYRRNKPLSGDVDIILSHRDESKTLNLISDVVSSLEQEGWITHVLQLRLTSTKRNQQTLALRPDGGARGFDTLDKALLVWQDIRYELSPDEPHQKNPNIHRRVDIIISSWSTVGCAILAWSGETTFQRDLRRYARKVKGWKFDSSGVRDRATGAVVGLEGVDGVSQTCLDAETKVFKGMDLVYREPWERCTG